MDAFYLQLVCSVIFPISVTFYLLSQVQQSLADIKEVLIQLEAIAKLGDR